MDGKINGSMIVLWVTTGSIHSPNMALRNEY